MKKIIGVVLAFALLTMTFAVMPVMAASPGEQKVPVKISWQMVPGSRIFVENYTTNGNISHIIVTLNLNVDLFIGDSSTPIKGTAEVYRDTDYRYKKPGGVDQVMFDTYVFSFPTAGGGFEGHAQSTLTDYNTGPPVTYDIRVHVLLHGTGAFEGQTLNAWQTGVGTIPLWEGYLLKP